MSNSHKHLRNLAINWSGHGCSLLVMFFLSPYIVGKLSAVDYGLWSLLTVMTGYMGIFDLGVRASVGRHVALYLGKRDNKGIDETIRAGFAVFTVSAVLILLVGVLLGILFPVLFRSAPLDHHDTMRYLLPFMAINIWLAAISTIYSSVLTSYSRFDIARSVDLTVLGVRTASTVFALYIGWGLWGLAGSMILSNFVALLVNRICAGRVFKELRSFPFLFSKLRMRELFGYGLFSFIYSISAKIINQSDLIIVGAFISVEAVREYSIGATIVYYSTPFFSLMGQTFFPSVQKKVGAGDMEAVHDLFYKYIRLSFCFGLLFYLGLAFFSENFIRLWMFQDGFDMNAVAEAATVMSILALSKLPSLYLHPCGSILSAMGYMRFTAMRAIAESIVNVLFSLFFAVTLKWGLAGVAAGTLAARLLIATISVPVFLFRKSHFSGRLFIAKAIYPAVLSGSLFALVCYLVTRNWHPSTWFSFFIHVSAAFGVWCLIAAMIWLPAGMRREFLSALRTRHINHFGG